MTDRIATPPWTRNHEGEPRRVGVELEMIGLTLDEIARIAADFLDADVTDDERYRRVLHGDPAGDWLVELDFRWLQQLGREDGSSEEFIGELRSSAEALLERLSDPLVPRELVSPPLPLQRLADVDAIIERLRQAGAKGTSDKARYAFGLQFNAEIPSTDPALITAFIRAFVCLYEWLYVRANVNLTRRITPYVDPFPIAYVLKVIATDYTPGLATLIDDYLDYNPTRNRALDVLPLFTYLDESRVRACTRDPLIKPRPAFHYRLPDCDIDRPGWGLSRAWNDWVEVERLACDPQRLNACARAYTAFLEQPLKRWLGNWAKTIETEWIPG